MEPTLTQWLQQSRFTIVAVDPEHRLVRLRTQGDVCTDLTCSDATIVVADDGPAGGVAGLNPGDIVKVEGPTGRPERIVVVRRVWDELTSPET